MKVKQFLHFDQDPSYVAPRHYPWDTKNERWDPLITSDGWLAHFDRNHLLTKTTIEESLVRNTMVFVGLTEWKGQSPMDILPGIMLLFL
jgi:hypothetical protein